MLYRFRQSRFHRGKVLDVIKTNYQLITMYIIDLSIAHLIHYMSISICNIWHNFKCYLMVFMVKILQF